MSKRREEIIIEDLLYFLADAHDFRKDGLKEYVVDVHRIMTENEFEHYYVY